MKSENEIPKFDLAQQIMAGHRKFTAVKRIAPRKKDIRLKTPDISTQTTIEKILSKESNIKPAAIPMGHEHGGYAIPSTNPADQIISEIVARDIQNFRSR